jgi:uncharacterized membrane protein YdjX (TVP38/TMEM64 family)
MQGSGLPMPVAQPPLPLRTPPHRTRPGRRRSRRDLVRWLVAAAVVAGLVAGLVWALLPRWNWQAVPEIIAGLDTPASLLAMAVLPLTGFAIGAVYLVAGMKFGPVVGGLVVAAVTAFHLVASHLVARRLLRGPIERWLSRRRHHLPHIPKDDDVAVSALVAIVPGLPYSVRNYFLALADVPLRIYLPICLGIYVARAYVTIFLGDLTINPDGQRLWLLGGIYVVKLGISAELIRRLRRRHRRKVTDQATQK